MWGASKKTPLMHSSTTVLWREDLRPPQDVACLADVLSKWATGVLPCDRDIGESAVGEKPASIIFEVVNVFSTPLHGLHRERFLEGTHSV